MEEKRIEVDIAVVGGGVAGITTALIAARNGLRVAVMEKATIEYAGCVTGVDHYVVRFPSLLEQPDRPDVEKPLFGPWRYRGVLSPKGFDTILRYFFKPILLLEEIGVRIYEDDGYIYGLQENRTKKGTVWGPPEKDERGNYYPVNMVYFRGTGAKTRLALALRKEAEKGNVHILDRTMAVSVLTKNNKAVGVWGINVRSGDWIVLKSRSVVIATGTCARLYPYPYAAFPNNLFFTQTTPLDDGSGYVLALESGAKLVNMEFLKVWPVSRGINSSSGGGGAGWYLRMRNSQGEYLEEKYHPAYSVWERGGYCPNTNYMFAPTMEKAEVLNDVIVSERKDARDEEITAIYFTAAAENPPRALKFHALTGGVRNQRAVECYPNIAGLVAGGVRWNNDWGETDVENLFAVGDITQQGGFSGGLSMGWAVADFVTSKIKGGELPLPEWDSEIESKCKEIQQRVFAPLNRTPKRPVSPLELEDYVRSVINMHYIGIKKKKSRLERAIELLERVKEEVVPALVAKNPHELMRCLEVQNIITVSLAHAKASLERTESRVPPHHYREDFPEEDPNWHGYWVVVQLSNGKLEVKKEKVE